MEPSARVGLIVRSGLACGLAIGLGLARADANMPLLGRWEAGDRAGQARYGQLLIRPDTLEWSGSAVSPGCRVAYRLHPLGIMASYPDALPSPEPAAQSRRHQVFRLTLAPRRCTLGRTELQFAIATDHPERAELIGYDRSHRPVSWGHVLRPPAAP